MIINKKVRLSLGDIDNFSGTVLRKINKFVKDEDIIFDVRLSLEEALINAVKHGNREDKQKTITVQVHIRQGALRIDIEDEGTGFDSDKIASPAEDGAIEKLSGRGVFLIHQFMDRVSFSRGGRRITMVKDLKRRN